MLRRCAARLVEALGSYGPTWNAHKDPFMLIANAHCPLSTAERCQGGSPKQAHSYICTTAIKDHAAMWDRSTMSALRVRSQMPWQSPLWTDLVHQQMCS